MKKVILAALAIMPLWATSQNFKLLATDGTGDAHSFASDATEFSYTLSTNADSLYVKIGHSNTRYKDFGYALAIDTNLNPNDGHAVNQTNIFAQPNTAMKADILLMAYQNQFFPGLYYESYGPNGSPLAITFELDTNDTMFSIFKIPLSELGGNIDFNLIGFTGGFDISGTGPSDAVPNSTFSQVRESHVGLTEHFSTNAIYPNPAKDFFISENEGKLTIVDAHGQVVKIITANSGEAVDCRDLKPGMYQVLYNETNSAGKLIIQ